MARNKTYMKFKITIKVYSMDKTQLEELRQEIKTILSRFGMKYGDSITANHPAIRQI